MSDTFDPEAGPGPTPERRRRILERGRARRRRNQQIRAAAVLLAAVAVLVPVALSQRHQETVRSGDRDHHEVTVPAPTARVRPSTTTAAEPTAPPTTAASTSGPPRNVAVDRTTVATLRALFAEYKGFAVDEVAPDEVATSTYEAFAPRTQTYWALVTFRTSGAMTAQHAVDMQDGGNAAIFARGAGGTWRVVALRGEPYPCHVLPPDVERLWGMAPNEASLCGTTPEVPVGGPLDLVLGANDFLYPAGWTVTLLHQEGPVQRASAVRPGGDGSITLTMDGSFPQDQLYASDGRSLAMQTILERERPCDGWSASARSSTQWGEFDCPPTAPGSVTRGAVRLISGNRFFVATLVVTLPGSDESAATTILRAFEGDYGKG